MLCRTTTAGLSVCMTGSSALGCVSCWRAGVARCCQPVSLVQRRCLAHLCIHVSGQTLVLLLPWVCCLVLTAMPGWGRGFPPKWLQPSSVFLTLTFLGSSAVVWYVHRNQKTSQEQMHRAVIVDKQTIKARERAAAAAAQQQQQDAQLAQR